MPLAKKQHEQTKARTHDQNQRDAFHSPALLTPAATCEIVSRWSCHHMPGDRNSRDVVHREVKNRPLQLRLRIAHSRQGAWPGVILCSSGFPKRKHPPDSRDL
jgi:hypothetical protein